MLVKLEIIFPKFPGENKRYVKPPPSKWMEDDGSLVISNHFPSSPGNKFQGEQNHLVWLQIPRISWFFVPRVELKPTWTPQNHLDPPGTQVLESWRFVKMTGARKTHKQSDVDLDQVVL